MVSKLDSDLQVHLYRILVYVQGSCLDTSLIWLVILRFLVEIKSPESFICSNRIPTQNTSIDAKKMFPHSKNLCFPDTFWYWLNYLFLDRLSRQYSRCNNLTCQQVRCGLCCLAEKPPKISVLWKFFYFAGFLSDYRIKCWWSEFWNILCATVFYRGKTLIKHCFDNKILNIRVVVSAFSRSIFCNKLHKSRPNHCQLLV